MPDLGKNGDKMPDWPFLGSNCIQKILKNKIVTFEFGNL
jgi:hypothetical protein